MAMNPNFNDMLFFHPSDTPDMNLVTDQLIGTENYGVWSRAMLIALRGKNKIRFIDGTCNRPISRSPTVQQWDRCNALVLSWIINTVSKDIFRGIVYATEASVVWSDLKEHFDKVNGSRICFAFENSKSNSHDDSSTDRGTTIFDNLPRRISSSYDFYRNSAVFFPNQSRRDPQQNEVLKCDYCNWNGHTQATCYRFNGYPPGHKMFKPQGKGVPQKVMKNRRQQFDANVVERDSFGIPTKATHDAPFFSQAQYAEILKLLGKCNTETPHEPMVNMVGTGQMGSLLLSHFPKVPWIIDTGANEHMVGDLLTLQNSESIADSSGTVGLPNGSKVSISRASSVALTDSIMLRKVLQIPDFRFNLRSVSKLTKEHQCYVTFYPHFCVFQDLKTRQIMGIGRERNKLYHLDNTNSSHSGFFSLSHVSTSSFKFQ
ncbi:uncharacterized protein [Primulina huaijiensis]|uniref:uncharacterized protein n=1 Tax=Primulina huaijiensis TaxID=1492673 RepID=UPI003CC70826